MATTEAGYDYIHEPIDGGIRLFRRGDIYLDALSMMFNWRLCETPVAEPTTYDRFWCYEGRGMDDLYRLTAHAVVWLIEGGDEPAGWIKSWDGRYHGGTA